MKHTLLIAEDDVDDQLLLESVFEELKLLYKLAFVENGIKALEYLKENSKELPSLILLDSNMPKKDGRETLIEIKSNEGWRSIPIIVFTTSDSEADIAYSYKHGTNAFITKPLSFCELKEIVESIDLFWLKTARLP
ncbi:MAG: CheY-like chemotaxis protein [Spirosomataceae bacterium]